jgi:hypothetical protein
MKHFRQDVLLTKEDCQAVLDAHEYYDLTKVKLIDGDYLDVDTINKYRGLRKESIVPLDPNLKLMLLERLKPFGVVKIPDYNMVVKYEQGEECKKHSDKGTDSITGERYKTIIIQLSNQNEYSGGSLIVESKEELPADNTQGNVIIFDSELEHYVTKVKSGCRLAQVIWLNKEDMGIKKGLL